MQLTTAMVPFTAGSVANLKRVSILLKALVMSAKLGRLS